jgi:UTP--glucose-1-phosphate uridylyltransferase
VQNATYYDTGSKLGWLKANVDFALERDELKDEFKKYLLKKIK